MAHSSTHQHSEQNVEKGKFDIGPAEFAVDAGSPLPEGYGDNRLIIMARDPLWFFAYWEITHERAEQIRQVHGRDIWDRALLVLRVYDAGDVDHNGMDDAPYFDVEVHKFAKQCYIQVPCSGHSYVADLGLRLPDGRYIALFRSNRIRLPSGAVSDVMDAQWMAVQVSYAQEEWDRFLRAGAGLGDGSAEFAKTMAHRWEFLKSVFSGSVSSWPSSKTWIEQSTPQQESKKHE